MKLPRWLSPVRTVEAETGWPRALCKEFARAASGSMDRREVVETILILPIVFLAGFVLFLLIDGVIPSGLTRQYGAVGILYELPGVMLMYGVPIVLFVATYFAMQARSARRLARRHIQRPRCLKCQYPVPDTADGAGRPTCPECGEPIPPEIAALAAERAGG